MTQAKLLTKTSSQMSNMAKVSFIQEFERFISALLCFFWVLSRKYQGTLPILWSETDKFRASRI
jgi:hypothetical protein